MIQDHTIDQTLIELARTMKALRALRAARKGAEVQEDVKRKFHSHWTIDRHCLTEHATTLRASMDLTRKLADLRQGR